jgi:hypothetical protein
MPDGIHLGYDRLLELQVLYHVQTLCNELNNTTGVLDLLLSFGADVTGPDDDRDADATLAQQLRVAVVEEVDDWGSLGGRRCVQELLAVLLGDERNELCKIRK